MAFPITNAASAAVGLGTAVLAAVGVYSYGVWAPGAQLFGRSFIAPRRPGEIALTFDDGPNPAWTPRLLDVLASQGVQATFFLLGSHARPEQELVRRVAAGGHLVGSHGWSHPNLAFTPTARIEEELRLAKQAIEQLTGEPIRYFRPPYGARRPAVLRVARELGMTPVMWNAMTSDWSNPSADSIYEKLANRIDALQARGWAADVVLHDGNPEDRAAYRGPSVTAAGMLIKRYRESHRFVRLDAWV